MGDVDEIAREAYARYCTTRGGGLAWQDLSADERKAWRAVVNHVVDRARPPEDP
ncbi:hypothetical protein [Actinomadura flavalba]|uniref:hypothetical protein n=1 Tax=Actinomadura flavalba TaxID=1120938 RepID=UPI000377A713|nr:hypothetical protein [Actinomadura flavalba]